MKQIVGLLAALCVLGCAHSPSPEEITAARAKIDQDCRSRYRPNTEEFSICVQQGRMRSAMGQGQGLDATQQAAIGAGAIGLLGTALMLSDVRLKRDVELVGNYRGFNLYSFRYLWSDAWHVGVMAQEVQAVRPEAVEEWNGYLVVNYGRL